MLDSRNDTFHAIKIAYASVAKANVALLRAQGDLENTLSMVEKRSRTRMIPQRRREDGPDAIFIDETPGGGVTKGSP